MKPGRTLKILICKNNRHHITSTMHFKLDKRFQDNDVMALIIFSAENLALKMDDSMLQLFFFYHCEAIKVIKEIDH